MRGRRSLSSKQRERESAVPSGGVLSSSSGGGDHQAEAQPQP